MFLGGNKGRISGALVIHTPVAFQWECASQFGETVVIPRFFTNTLSFSAMYALTRSVSRLGFVSRSLQCSSRLYHDLVIDHYEHPRNVGKRALLRF